MSNSQKENIDNTQATNKSDKQNDINQPIRPNKDIVPPKYQTVTEGYDPSNLKNTNDSKK